VWVNSGFFVIEPRALDVIGGDDEAWENGPLEHLAHDGQLAAFRHEGFWHCMDTPKDRQVLEDLWKTDRASWKLW
jgi:glucose-1-phosphate cytidylyltransferase